MHAPQVGRAPLHHAALNGHKDCVALLLERGAKVDTATKVRWQGWLRAQLLGYGVQERLPASRAQSRPLLHPFSSCSCVALLDKGGTWGPAPTTLLPLSTLASLTLGSTALAMPPGTIPLDPGSSWLLGTHISR